MYIYIYMCVCVCVYKNHPKNMPTFRHHPMCLKFWGHNQEILGMDGWIVLVQRLISIKALLFLKQNHQ